MRLGPTGSSHSNLHQHPLPWLLVCLCVCMCGWVYCEKYPLSVLEIISDFFPLKQRLLMVSLPCVRFKVCVFKFGDTVVLTGLLWVFFFFKKQCCRAWCACLKSWSPKWQKGGKKFLDVPSGVYHAEIVLFLFVQIIKQAISVIYAATSV